MSDPGPAWSLHGFEGALDAWIDRYEPGVDLRIKVTAWVVGRAEDPYAGVRRAPQYGNLWWGPIPGAVHPPNLVVLCSYWISESTRSVHCGKIASLPYQPV